MLQRSPGVRTSWQNKSLLKAGDPLPLGFYFPWGRRDCSGWSRQAAVGRWPALQSSWRCVAGRPGCQAHALSLGSRPAVRADLGRPPGPPSFPGPRDIPPFPGPDPASESPEEVPRGPGPEPASFGLAKLREPRGVRAASGSSSLGRLCQLSSRGREPAFPVLGPGKGSRPRAPSAPAGRRQTSRLPPGPEEQPGQ